MDSLYEAMIFCTTKLKFKKKIYLSVPVLAWFSGIFLTSLKISKTKIQNRLLCSKKLPKGQVLLNSPSQKYNLTQSLTVWLISAANLCSNIQIPPLN